MSRNVWLPDSKTVEGLHHELTKIFETEADPISPPGIKSSSLLDSACHRPRTSLGGHDKYKDLYQKIAALFHSLTKNHAFHNGNKRTAVVALLTTLYRNDKIFKIDIDDDIIFNFVLSVTSDQFPSSENSLSGDQLIISISEWISQNCEPLDRAAPGMRLNEFLEKCKSAGCNIKKSGSGGSWIVTNGLKGSVRISQETKKIDGNVVRHYLRALSLALSKSGVTENEFLEGYDPERQEIHRFMRALRSLAKT